MGKNPVTLVELLRTRAETAPDRVLYRYLKDGSSEEATLTYGALDQAARRTASLLARDLKPGDRALICHLPGLEYIASFFGCLYAGVVAVPVYPPRFNSRLDRIEAIVSDVGARAALTSSSLREALGPMLGEYAFLRELRWITESDASGGIAPRDARPEDIAFIQYTSGSTSLPKGVMLTHANLLANLELTRAKFECTSRDSGVFWLPPYHDMGLIGGLLQAPYSDFQATLMSPYAFLQRPVRWLQAMSRYGGTVSGAPNFAYDLCTRRISDEDAASLDLSRWRLAFCGAEPIRQDTMEAFARKFACAGFRAEALYPCYGLAEATLMLTGGRPGRGLPVKTLSIASLENDGRATAPSDDRDARAFVGCGSAAPEHSIRIVNPATEECLPDGRVGEIRASGPSIAPGYWGKPDEPLGPELKTGDLGFLSEGELYVTGRIKDLIILNGRNVYPQDLEKTIASAHPAASGRMAAVFSVSSTGVERVCAIQELERKSTDDLPFAEIAARIREAVFENHEVRLSALVFVKARSIPLTSSGKVQRGLARRRFTDGGLEELHRIEWDA